MSGALGLLCLPLISEDKPKADAAKTEEAAPPRPEAPKEGEPMNKEQLEYSIWFVNQHIETRKKRAQEIGEDLRRQDKRIEERIDRILKILADNRDSADSSTRMAVMKMDGVEGLQKTIEYYNFRRRLLKEDFMRPNPQFDRDLILEDLDVFNARVEKRVKQILDLAKTMEGYKNIDRYKSYGRGGYWGGHYVVRNPEYYQNRKQTRRTDMTQKNIAEEIDKEVRLLKVTERQITDTLKHEITQQYRDLLEGELERIRGVIRTRENQMQGLITANANPGGRRVGKKQADNIQSLVEDISKDLKRDFYAMFEDYGRLNKERSQLKVLYTQLDGYNAALDALE